MNQIGELIQLETAHPHPPKKPNPKKQKGGDGEGGYFFSQNSCLIHVIVQQLKHASRRHVKMVTLLHLICLIWKKEKKIFENIFFKIFIFLIMWLLKLQKILVKSNNQNNCPAKQKLSTKFWVWVGIKTALLHQSLGGIKIMLLYNYPVIDKNILLLICT